MFQVKFADIGEGLTEGKVVEIFVKVGDIVKEGQELFAVETDKVNSDIYAPVGGKILKINIKPDQEIKVGEVVIEIDNGGAGPSPSKQVKEEVVEENASVVGSTPVSNDVIVRNVATSNQSNGGLFKATPLARKVAAEKNIDLSTIKPSGPNNRILLKDLDQKNSSGVLKQSSQSFIPTQGSIVKTVYNGLSWESIPMNGIRKATVKAMEASSSEKAAFSAFKYIDFTQIYNLRKKIKQSLNNEDIKLTFLAFVVKAVAKALRKYPNVNVRIDKQNNAILQLNNINVGIAVDTPKGLFVPNIKNTDQLSILEIAQQITEMADKARSGKLATADMSDGTFTITNFGSVGIEFATPIINGQESAILGLGAMTKQPKYNGENLEPAWIMPFSITCDHRIIDGADAGRFLQEIEKYATDPLLLLL
ncbi:dihydrolipoamide acetyltransferase family protein [Spiroplasma endosymbiont of Aspidapion aeneum]|uniref:dihydrolipoamide acetyltransferase family protein n=1 Tax=Spiroplasma endosymbiont of Aspidapion aeneum TaxID=3066276 RepID=UPI00313EBC4F